MWLLRPSRLPSLMLTLTLAACTPREGEGPGKPLPASPVSVGTTAGAPSAKPSASESAAVAASRKACDEGDMMECFSLGYAYEQGDGAPKDEPRGITFYEKSCDRGMPPSCYNLGRMLADGRGAPKDEARALTLFRKACKDGINAACARVPEAAASAAPAKSP